MQRNIMISGTGGQGVIAAADFLGEALFGNGYHVVCTRSYGAEARGGSAQSVVIASDQEIYDIQFEKADMMLVLSLPAYRKFSSAAKVGGLVVVDSRVVSRLKPEEVRRDVEQVAVPAADIAERLGNPIVANMVMLGAFTAKTGLITLDQLRGAVKTLMRPQFHEINLKAIEAGAASI
ncbi:2-oxoacid:acceptor oxidoreductase family protein [Candidatus Bathyarchaeota archaeon]|nr:2-oxoacid:acceptor oxidoreductase family protein [Candidatus Bathyarchaeota archaeon]